MATPKDKPVNQEWISRLKKVKKIYSHKSCPDGTMAALICAAAYQGAKLSPEIEFIQYGTKDEKGLKPEPGQLFVDITPPEDRWEEWRDVSPIVLDHHETREHITKGLNGIYGYPEYSGASLAFTHVLVPLWYQVIHGIIDKYLSNPSAFEMQKAFEKRHIQKWAKFAILAQIRDTWKSDHPEWFDAASFGQGLAFFGSKLLLDDVENHELDLDEVLRIGRIVYGRILRKAGYIAEASFFTTYHCQGEKYKLGFFNTTEKNTSEVCHHLLEESGCDLAAGYFTTCQEGKFRIIVSLRTGGRLNARKIAEVWKGGGHPNAAGFKMDGPNGDGLAHTFEDIVHYVQSAIGHSIRGD